MLVGIANIIPGVSGGTFALVLGIYERLLASVGAFGARSGKILFRVLIRPTDPDAKAQFGQEFRRTDALWLMVLMFGAGVAILASSHLIAFLLDQHREPTFSFFVGLILPSVLVPLALLDRRGFWELLSCLSAIAALVGLVMFFEPATGEGTGLISLFAAGAIAISAMILPGVSGSFILMVMGEYRTVLLAINTMDFTQLAVFGAGCVLGLLAFVRLLNFLLRRFHSVTIAFLIGLILGSLWVLWPFKEVAEGAKIITGTNIWPQTFGPEFAWSIASFVLGLVCSAGLYFWGKDRK